MMLASSLLSAQTEDPLDVEYKKLKSFIKQNAEWIAEQESNKKLAISNIAKFEAELKQLEDLNQNRNKYQQQVLQEVDKELKEVPGIIRVVSKKAAYFRCLKDSLGADKSGTFQSCMRNHPTKLSAAEKQQVEKWTSLLGLTSDEIKFKVEKIKLDLLSQETAIKVSEERIESALPQKERLLEDEQKLLMKFENRTIAKENPQFVNCDEKTPDISLEEEVPYPGADFKGPFVGIPRDNQDGVGTCYANTAKNLLVGTSQGKDVASFLDLALLYKEEEGVISSGLDGGFSCHVLKKLKDHGYCPQGLSPIETGEANPYNEGWLGSDRVGLWGQSIVFEYLQKFLDGKEKFTKQSPEMSEKILAKAKDLINKIKANPQVKIPLPVVRYPIPSFWKLKETYEWNKGAFPGTSFTAFQDEYSQQYKKFYPVYARAVYDGKDAHEIFNLFKEKMKPFLDKYKIHSGLDEWKRVYLIDSASDFKDPKLKASVSASLDLLKSLTGKEDETNEEFLEHCGESEGSFLDFLGSMRPLLERLKDDKIDTDLLFNEKGEFKAPTELMQLAIAPACLSQENRKKLDHKIICEDGYQTIRDIKSAKISDKEKQLKVREIVVANLIQGYPMGNTFERHINTIVGMRFNKDSKRCEYKIRESQTGASTWQSEDIIFNKIEALTEVRRK